MERQELWEMVLGELEVSLSRANFGMWFRDTFIAEDTGETIVIGVPNNFYLSWIRDKYHKPIADTLRKFRPALRDISYKIASKRPIPEVSLGALGGSTLTEPTPDPELVAAVAAEAGDSSREEREKLNDPIVLPPRQGAEPSSLQSTGQFSQSFQSPVDQGAAAPVPAGHTPLDPSRVFENFIVGNSNRLAHAVCLAAAQEPGLKYNPLFIYGGVGLGKTHLAQAIGNEIRQKSPGIKITYVSCEVFTNEFIEAVRKNSLDFFKKRYRNTDVLLIDDVQFMSGKERTQEEFFHTFNALHQAKKQIVMTADREPKDIPQMEDRLTSRFAWGMVADIQPPDFETRIAILQSKCIEHSYQMDSDSIEALARIVQSNIRELEGALQRVVTQAEVDRQPITPEFVIKIYGAMADALRGRSLNATRIIETVSEFFQLKPDEVVGDRRFKELVYPRQLVMYLMRHELSYSYPKIGKELGGKDHTTVMHGVDKIEKELARNTNIQYDLSKLKEKIHQGN